MNNRKPLQVYLDGQERQDLQEIATSLGEKTLSSTMKRLIKIFRSLGDNNNPK